MAFEIDDVIKKGLNRFTSAYATIAENIQIAFVKKVGTVQYVMCVNSEPRNTVELKQLIGKNVYNSLAEKKIFSLLEKFDKESRDCHIIVGMKAGNIYYHMYNKKTLVRAISQDELK